jgi:hypothetical protein
VWQTFMKEHVAYVDNNVLTQMIEDLKQEYEDRVTEILENDNDDSK